MSDAVAAPKGGVAPCTKRVMNLARFLLVHMLAGTDIRSPWKSIRAEHEARGSLPL